MALGAFRFLFSELVPLRIILQRKAALLLLSRSGNETGCTGCGDTDHMFAAAQSREPELRGREATVAEIGMGGICAAHSRP